MNHAPTARLYYEDSYRTEFTGRLLDTITLEDGRPAALLEATYFYPTSGGQQHDLGELAGRKVIEVLELGSSIAHVLDAPLAASRGAELVGRIDAGRRRAHRQQHSGQHVLSRALEELLDLPTDSARLGEHVNTIDLKSDRLDSSDLDRVYARANEIVWEARPVRAHQLASEEADDAQLRKKSERSGIVRVIEVEGFDRCPCGGTHVRNTGEIGLIAPVRNESIARGVRLHFLCGERALAHLCERDNLLGELALRFTSGASELGAKFQKLLEENRELNKALSEAEAARLRESARGWLEHARPIAGSAAQGRLLIQELPEDLAPRIQSATPLLRAQEDLLTILVLMGAEKAQILVCRGSDCPVDCGALLRELLDGLEGRGGGNVEQARGSLPAAAWPAARQRLNARFPTP